MNEAELLQQILKTLNDIVGTLFGMWILLVVLVVFSGLNRGRDR